jgi:predicted hotdog family 3-hydroxylacyl-ACP dehydratase
MSRHYLPAKAYLPHAAPMVLIEEVIDVGETSAHCRVKVSKSGILSPFLTPTGALPAWFAIELMAQTVGVWSGWHGEQQGAEPKLGMLLGGRGLKCAVAEFAAESLLDIRVEMMLRDEKLANFECAITLADGENGQQEIAHARLNTYQPDADEIIKLTQGMQQ